MGAGPAEDAVGQDHASHPAQDRRERARPARRHQHAGRSVRRRFTGQGAVHPAGVTLAQLQRMSQVDDTRGEAVAGDASWCICRVSSPGSPFAAAVPALRAAPLILHAPLFPWRHTHQ
ncbi:hypothetical protein LUTEI9C_150022 [Luteimonas sp. 9C]|nr:hypothetical protein LUTEI9C_150022 [Luteimonas sp. 9C]